MDKLENKKELEGGLKKLKIEIIKTDTFDGKKIYETFFMNGKIEPIKNINPEYRPDFRCMLEELLKANKIKITKENLLKNFSALRESDFDILLNNFLKRIKIEPVTGEDFSILLEDFEKGEFNI